MKKEKWFEGKERQMETVLSAAGREKAILAMEEDLMGSTEATPKILRAVVEVAVDRGYRKERYTEWELDTSFESATKVRYRCKACGFWQVAKEQNAQSMLRSLRYCPGCGAKKKRGAV